MRSETGNRWTEEKTSARSDPLNYVIEEDGLSFDYLDDKYFEVERHQSDSVDEEDKINSSHDENLDEEGSDQKEELDVNEILKSGGEEDRTDSQWLP